MPNEIASQVYSETPVTITLPYLRPGQVFKIEENGPRGVIIQQSPILTTQRSFFKELKNLLESFNAEINADRDEGVNITLKGIEVIADSTIGPNELAKKLSEL
jgi:hypothetical protein